MALDGLFLFKLTEELNNELQNTRVEKIYQPSKEELVFVMRSRQGAKKLYFNCRADSARVHLSEQNFINPANPPMLCMLLRKKFTSAWLDSITQSGFERILTFNFTALNDFGDRVKLRIICEIMGRYSNISFVDDEGIIIDSVKRVGSNKSSVREVLPGKAYSFPPAQDKLDLLNSETDLIISRVLENKNALLSKALLKSIQGISPLRCNEIVFKAYGEDKAVYEIENDTGSLKNALEHLKKTLYSPAKGVIVSNEEKQVAFSFTEVEQFGSSCKKEYFDSLSVLLDTFYKNRINSVKRNASGGELIKKVSLLLDKINRKTALQKKELAQSEDCEKLKIFGELINANLYYLEPKSNKYSVLNYYTGEQIDIPADIMLTPAENAAKYYKEYRKKQNAKVYLKEQIKIGEEQLEYLESVMDILERAETPEDISAVKYELITQGFIKSKLNKREKNPKQLKPLEFKTENGFLVLVGRNNLLNDRLTFKIAKGNDIWFHTKLVHGSHTVLITDGRKPEEDDIIEAAGIAAYYSKATESTNVPVDYTFIKFVKRQASRIPGRVFYTDYKTVYVNPDKAEVEKLKK